MPGDQFQDVDPWAEALTRGGQAQGTLPVATTAPSTSVKERVLKMSNVLDQADDSEVVPAPQGDIDRWMAAYVAVMGAPPPEEEEPSEAQLSAVNKRVHHLSQAPYCDFGVFQPFGRKTMRTLKFRTYLPVGDGSYVLRELPGPQNFQQWLLSWRVFRTCALMLDIASLASLHAYEKCIERLVVQWPSAWGLICSADDKARAQHLDKIKRKFVQDIANGGNPPSDFSEDKPWTACFRALSMDEGFWDEQVRHPAAAWTASGSKGVPMAAAERLALAHHPGVDVTDFVKDDNDGRRRQSNRDRRQARAKRIRDDREELEKFRGKKNRTESRQGQGQGAKGKGRGKSKDQAGVEICYSFANGSGPCGSVSPGAACLQKIKRAHKCQICLSPGHRNADCPQGA